MKVVVYFFRRAADALALETRLNPAGAGFQIVVTRNGETQIEAFETLSAMLSREHELLQAWRAQGWSEVGTPPRTDQWGRS